MPLTLILASILLSALMGLVIRNHWRLPLLLGVSIMAIFILQPALPIRGLDFWLPTATLSLIILAWILTTPCEQRSWRSNWLAAAIMGGSVLVLGLTRYLSLSLPVTASRPPPTIQLLAWIAVFALVAFILTRFTKPGKTLLAVAFVLVILLLVAQKIPSMTTLISKALRNITHQSLSLASSFDIRWIGFSYVAFRLLHTLRDRQTGRLPAVSLSEYAIYVIFFPALAAGPIDRLERFIVDLRRPLVLKTGDLAEAGKRLSIGLFKKFIVADLLSLVALNAGNAFQVRTGAWTWLILYAYSFQVLFDFSGYTDIAIGLGRLLGIQLPENFKTPYLKQNLTLFWNNWHISLTQWFRAYFFNPLTRAFRSAKKPLPFSIIIFITQVVTMVLIGFWHGVTWNFCLWGLWHGLGLFIHNRWSELTRPRFSTLSPHFQRVLNIGGILLTFHFVTLSWIFFTLPSPQISWQVLMKLFGVT
jgi:alginate O-acetyltransferase complex protein AlgI